VLYDLINKKIVNVDTLNLKKHVIQERAINDSFPKLTSPKDPQYSIDLQIRKHDIDINRHVNNRITIEWSLEPVPDQIRKDFELSDIEITFKGQAFFGDKIRSELQLIEEKEQLTGLHHITNINTGQSITIVNTKWNKLKS